MILKGTKFQLKVLKYLITIPKGTVNDLITHYEYQVDKGTMEIKPQDMVHCRLGLDPSNHKKRFSPLKTVLRDI